MIKMKIQCDRKKSGIYLLFRRAMLHYIGSSNDIEYRVLQHRRVGRIEFDAAFFFECENYLEREAELIKELNPPMNRVHTGKYRSQLRKRLIANTRKVANS